MKILTLVLSTVLILAHVSLIKAATLPEIMTAIRAANRKLTATRITAIQSHLEEYYPTLASLPPAALQEALCHAACTIRFFVPQQYFLETCLICGEENVTKKNLPCCGKIMCKSCLLTICTDNLVAKGTFATTPCPFCKRPFMYGHLNRFLKKKKKIFFRERRKAKQRLKQKKHEQVEADLSTADDIYHAELVAVTAGDAAFAAALAAQFAAEEGAGLADEASDHDDDADAANASDDESSKEAPTPTGVTDLEDLD